MSKEFDLAAFSQMEVDMLQDLPESFVNCPAQEIKSAGPVDAADNMDQDVTPLSNLVSVSVNFCLRWFCLVNGMKGSSPLKDLSFLWNVEVVG